MIFKKLTKSKGDSDDDDCSANPLKKELEESNKKLLKANKELKIYEKKLKEMITEKNDIESKLQNFKKMAEGSG